MLILIKEKLVDICQSAKVAKFSCSKKPGSHSSDNRWLDVLHGLDSKHEVITFYIRDPVCKKKSIAFPNCQV